MEYRKFKLLNSNGDEYEFTNKDFKVFAHNPKGLGFSKSISTLRLGDENLLLYSVVNLDVIEFELLFYDDTLSDKYQKYFEFMQFIAYKPITLLYQRPNSFDWFRRTVEIVSLSKTEVSFRDSMLHCTFQMSPLTFWEDNEVNVLKLKKGDVEGGKIYPITYPFYYSGDGLSNQPMISQGLLDSPLKITVNGETTDAEWVLYDQNGNIYGRARFNGTFDSIVVNSKESEEEISLVKNELLLEDGYSYQDLSVGSPNEIYVTFLKLKPGHSKISFLFDLAFDGEVVVEWRNRYVSV